MREVAYDAVGVNTNTFSPGFVTVVEGRERWMATVPAARCTLHHMSTLERYGLQPDPVIEYYKQDVDRTLLREHLQLTPQQRLEKLMSFMRSLDALRKAAAARRGYDS